MEMKPVKSSNLKAVGYDAKTKKLRIDFLNNSSYIYSNVPEGTYNSLMSAASVGEFFTKFVRSKFSFEKS